MTKYISLLRGINVGGHRQIKMADLRTIYESMGFNNITVLLQTGNVIFTFDEADTDTLANRIEAECEKQFGFHTSVIILTQAELKKIVEANPFSNQPEKAPKWLIINFLASIPTPNAQAELRKYRGPEEMVITDKAVYIYYTEGAGRSKLTNTLIEKKLRVRATARNWNTCTKLLAL